MHKVIFFAKRRIAVAVVRALARAPAPATAVIKAIFFIIFTNSFPKRHSGEVSDIGTAAVFIFDIYYLRRAFGKMPSSPAKLSVFERPIIATVAVRPCMEFFSGAQSGAACLFLSESFSLYPFLRADPFVSAFKFIGKTVRFCFAFCLDSM